MDNMEKIWAKIKNLFDLANNNPNENEAIAAALKAQELMAKYNVALDQIEKVDEQTREIAELIYHETGGHHMKKWKYGLAKIIAENFRCKHYFLGRNDVVFYGYKEDAAIALQVFTYLYTVGNKMAVKHYNQVKKTGGSTQGVMNTYLMGFKDGVASVLQKQCTALMIVTPQEVKDQFAEKSKDFGSIHTTIKTNGKSNSAYNKGRADGRDMAQARSLEKAG